mmetsp:Transcript_46262/g.86377  ORF Transcript_46262/g.86377 Transcript_46262/m.86377 type:complete len:334 (+) Transcript_46262:92-1093(+)
MRRRSAVTVAAAAAIATVTFSPAFTVSEDGAGTLRQFVGGRSRARLSSRTRLQDFARQDLVMCEIGLESPRLDLRHVAAWSVVVGGSLWLLRVATGHLETLATAFGSLLSLKSVAAGSPWLAAACGAGAGALHTLSGPDHLAALAPLALRSRRSGAAFRTGVFWGSGHVAGQVLLGTGLLFVSRCSCFRSAGMRFGLWAEQLATLAVGVVLMTIGAMGLKESREWDAEQEESGTGTSFSWKTFATGLLSGMHPDALLLCLPALTLPTRSAGLVFLASFGAGSMLAMGGYTAALRAACKSLGDDKVRRVSFLASAMALTLGVGVCASAVGLFSL